jgi:hypothetical protein
MFLKFQLVIYVYFRFQFGHFRSFLSHVADSLYTWTDIWTPWHLDTCTNYKLNGVNDKTGGNNQFMQTVEYN